MSSNQKTGEKEIILDTVAAIAIAPKRGVFCLSRGLQVIFSRLFDVVLVDGSRIFGDIFSANRSLHVRVTACDVTLLVRMSFIMRV